MSARTLRKLLREPIWLVLLVALVLGAIVGRALAHEPVSEAALRIFGRPWRGDSTETREALAALLGFEVTIVTLVVTVNVTLMKGAAYNYSSRLIPIYLKGAPIRRSLPLFAFLATYILAAGRELGIVGETGVQPRIVVLGAVVILGVALVFLGIDLLRTFRFVRVEQVLGLVRDATLAAGKRMRGRVERLRLDATATLAVPRDASALVASESGYLVDIDMRRLAKLARDAGVRARVSRGIGEYVDKDEVIGWVTSDNGAPVTALLAAHIVDTLEIRASRELAYDPALGIRIMVDVANRALSSSYNDPYTAKQALDQLRSVLHHIGRLPLGDWNVIDSDGAVRVSVTATHLRELLSLAVTGPLYFGVDHPEVIEGLFGIVLEVGAVARDPEDRAAARTILERIEDLASRSELDPSRLARLRAEAEPVRRSLAGGQAPIPPG